MDLQTTAKSLESISTLELRVKLEEIGELAE